MFTMKLEATGCSATLAFTKQHRVLSYKTAITRQLHILSARNQNYTPSPPIPPSLQQFTFVSNMTPVTAEPDGQQRLLHDFVTSNEISC